MKRILCLLVVFSVGLIIFGLISNRADANSPIFVNGSQDELSRAKEISLEILKNQASFRAIGEVDQFEIKNVEIDELMMAHTRVRQTVNKIPVWEGEAIVHLTPTGELLVITDALKENIAVDTTPLLSEKDAINLAAARYSGKAEMTGDPIVGLYIYRGETRDHLAYRIEIPRIDGSDETSAPVSFIDAQTGEEVFEYNNLQTGTGSSLYSGTVTISTSQSGSTYYMEDLTRKMGTFNMNNTGSTSTGTGGTQSRYSGTDDSWTATNERAGVDAHYGAAKTFDYYKNVHGRNGIDGNYGPGTTSAAANGSISLVSSRVHFGSNYNNAFWYQNKMSYGDGNGTTFSPLTTIDICGHEMTHGVTERTANLTYASESGALNESMSDIFGAMVELYADGGSATTDTWKIGEDAYTPGTPGDALRRMDNPNSVGDPDHYSVRLYPGSCTPSSSNDNCGVHTNSSISNHAYFLIAAGGTNRVSGVTVPGIGTTDAAKIFYRALSVYMTSGTNFTGARTATLNAATDLFGSSSSQYSAVQTGWCAVGVGSCAGGTPTPTPTPTPGGGSELLVNGGFEGSASPWVGSGSGYFYTSNGNYPQGGTGYPYFGVNNSVSGQSYQTVSIPSNATGTFTFWLNVTSSETTTTKQYDKLFVEVRNTSGTLLSTLATYSNLNKGTAGVYSQKSFNLAAYKGQTVRIQFRTTMDSSVTTTFRVDTASLK
ncbi:MAG: M4 family metallopeptidase [Pyrinomonadaceae bacterium]|nr:M4 family metallopeptidase [Pyrinomonadaceae bacterium]